MATAAQLTANRANAQRSTGPKTAEGKAASAANATKHGFASTDFLLAAEDAAPFQHLLDSLFVEHQPDTPTEEFIVTEMARAQWRLNRILAMESQILSQTPLAEKFQNEAKLLLQIDRYAESARRAYFRALRELRNLRSSRVAEGRQAAAHEARELDHLIEAYCRPPVARRPQSAAGPSHLPGLDILQKLDQARATANIPPSTPAPLPAAPQQK